MPWNVKGNEKPLRETWNFQVDTDRKDVMMLGSLAAAEGDTTSAEAEASTAEPLAAAPKSIITGS